VLCAGLRLWPTGGGPARRASADAGYVVSLAFTPDGRRAVTGNAAGAVTLWDVAALAPLRRFDAPAKGGKVWGVAAAPGGRRFLSGHDEGMVRLWDDNGRALARWEGHGGAVRCVAFVRDETRALSGGNGKLILWDTATGKVLARHEGGPNPLGLAVTADGRHAVTADDDGSVRLWQLPE
jgi:WD40 repeat protein